jgi:redox-sensitive bicupin YhaK (pirin superfamily)
VIHQDVDLFAAVLGVGEKATHSLKKGRRGWLQVVRGSVDANGQTLDPGDAAALQDEAALTLTSRSDGAEILLFDLP